MLYDTYTWEKNTYNVNDIIMTVALPVFNSKNIIFLPLESLKNQKEITFKWELIISEEHGLSRNIIKQYENKLPGCVKIIHNGIDPLKQGIQEGKNKGIYQLIDKWIDISRMGSKNSQIYVLQASDDYATEKRLKIHYEHFKNPECILSSMNTGIFYNILNKKIILYDARKIKNLHYKTHLNMAYRKNI